MEQVCNGQTTDRRSPSLTALCHLKAEQQTGAEVVFVVNPITELHRAIISLSGQEGEQMVVISRAGGMK